jgi:hypothetical protein
MSSGATNRAGDQPHRALLGEALLEIGDRQGTATAQNAGTDDALEESWTRVEAELPLLPVELPRIADPQVFTEF